MSSRWREVTERIPSMTKAKSGLKEDPPREFGSQEGQEILSGPDGPRDGQRGGVDDRFVRPGREDPHNRHRIAHRPGVASVPPLSAPARSIPSAIARENGADAGATRTSSLVSSLVRDLGSISALSVT